MRHFVLVSYDISDDKRLRRMFKLMNGYGEHLQYSVFLCQLTEKDQTVLTEKIKDIINHKEDQAILITLGPVRGKNAAASLNWRVLGTSLALADNSVMIY